MKKLQESLRLCLVTHIKNQTFEQYQPFLMAAIKGGVTLIQLREKNKSLTELRILAQQLKNFLTPFNIPLIINDHVELAKEINAEGVHLGQSDANPKLARQILGPDKMIGLSVETLAELEIANQLEINYIAASAIFPSKTKTDCKTIWGLDGLQQIAQRTTHPLVAIGGITELNAYEVIKHGAQGIAVISVIHDSKDPEKTAGQLLMQMENCWMPAKSVLA